MALLLGLLLFSFLVNAVLFVPFINLLYRLRFQRQQQSTRDAFGILTPIFNKFHASKAGTPVGGGLMTLIITPILFFVSLLIMHYFWLPITSAYPLKDEIKILLFTFFIFWIFGPF